METVKDILWNNVWNCTFHKVKYVWLDIWTDVQKNIFDNITVDMDIKEHIWNSLKDTVEE
jgi:hypothetical protein